MFLVRLSGSSSTRHLHPANHSPYNTGANIYLFRSVCRMIVIGIDPGLARLGYGVIEVNERGHTDGLLWMYRNIR